MRELTRLYPMDEPFAFLARGPSNRALVHVATGTELWAHYRARVFDGPPPAHD